MFSPLCAFDLPGSITALAVAPGNRHRVMAVGLISGFVVFETIEKKPSDEVELNGADILFGTDGVYKENESSSDAYNGGPKKGEIGVNQGNNGVILEESDEEEEEEEEEVLSSSPEPSDGRSGGYRLSALASLSVSKTAIRSLCWSSDSNYLAIGTKQSELFLFDTIEGDITWDNKNSRLQSDFKIPERERRKLKFNKNMRREALKQIEEKPIPGSDNEASSHELPELGPGLGAVSSIAFQGNRVIAGYESGEVRIYNIKSNVYVRVFDAADYISSIGVQGRLMCAASGDGSIYTYRLSQPKSSTLALKLVQTTLTEEEDITSVAFLDFSSHRMFCDEDGDINEPRTKKTPEGPLTAEPYEGQILESPLETPPGPHKPVQMPIKFIDKVNKKKRKRRQRKHRSLVAEVSLAGLKARNEVLGGVEERHGLVIAGTTKGKLMTYIPGSAAYKSATNIVPKGSIDTIIPFEGGYVIVGCSDGLVRICEIESAVAIRDVVPCPSAGSMIGLVNIMNTHANVMEEGDYGGIPRLLVSTSLGSRELLIFERTNKMIAASPTLSPIVSPLSTDVNSDISDYSDADNSNKRYNIGYGGVGCGCGCGCEKAAVKEDSDPSSIMWEEGSNSSFGEFDMQDDKVKAGMRRKRQPSVSKSPNQLRTLRDIPKLSKNARRCGGGARRETFFRDLESDSDNF